MERSRRNFLKDTAIGGAGLRIFGMPAVAAGQAPQLQAIPTPRLVAAVRRAGARFGVRAETAEGARAAVEGYWNSRSAWIPRAPIN
jgi:hypothetical protein